MQTSTDSCSPERLRTLQSVFDTIWLEVQTGNCRATIALRDEIARRVTQHVDDVDPKPDEIVQAVIRSLRVDSGILQPTGAQVEVSVTSSHRVHFGFAGGEAMVCCAPGLLVT